MNGNAQASKKRIRIALAKAKDITRRQADLEKCLSEEHQVALEAALADEYATLLEEYPDVFPAPPVSAAQVRAHARELRETQAALERDMAEAAEAAEATRKAHSAFNAALEAPKPPEKPS